MRWGKEGGGKRSVESRRHSKRESQKTLASFLFGGKFEESCAALSRNRSGMIFHEISTISPSYHLFRSI